jgi:hypothetical protein
LSRSDVPAPAVPQQAPVAEAVAVPRTAPVARLVAAPKVSFPAQAVPRQPLTTLDPVAFQQMVRQNPGNARQLIVKMGQQIQQQFDLVATALRQ